MYASTHLKVYDRLWSVFPYGRQMATFVHDTLGKYGIDNDGAGLHDVLGPVSSAEMHETIENSFKEYGIKCNHVLDGWNTFICSGVTKSHEYFEKPSPAKKGDYIEFLADMNLVVSVHTLMSGTFYVDEEGLHMDDEYFPVDIEIFRGKIEEENNDSSV